VILTWGIQGQIQGPGTAVLPIGEIGSYYLFVLLQRYSLLIEEVDVWSKKRAIRC
jgi:hypothetical protein